MSHQDASFDVYLSTTLMRNRADLLMWYLLLARYVDPYTRDVTIRIPMHSTNDNMLVDVKITFKYLKSGKFVTSSVVRRININYWFDGQLKNLLMFLGEIMVAIVATKLAYDLGRSTIRELHEAANALERQARMRVHVNLRLIHITDQYWDAVIQLFNAFVPLLLVLAMALRCFVMFTHLRKFQYANHYKWYDGEGSSQMRILLPKRDAPLESPPEGYPRGSFRHTLAPDPSEKDANLKMIDDIDTIGRYADFGTFMAVPVFVFALILLMNSLGRMPGFMPFIASISRGAPALIALAIVFAICLFVCAAGMHFTLGTDIEVHSRYLSSFDGLAAFIFGDPEAMLYATLTRKEDGNLPMAIENVTIFVYIIIFTILTVFILFQYVLAIITDSFGAERLNRERRVNFLASNETKQDVIVKSTLEDMTLPRHLHALLYAMGLNRLSAYVIQPKAKKRTARPLKRRYSAEEVFGPDSSYIKKQGSGMKSFSAAAHTLIDSMRFARRLEGLLAGEDLEQKSIAQLHSNILFSEKNSENANEPSTDKVPDSTESDDLFSEKNSEKDNEPSTDKVTDSTESVVVDTHVISVKVDDDHDDRDDDRDVPIIMDVLTKSDIGATPQNKVDDSEETMQDAQETMQDAKKTTQNLATTTGHSVNEKRRSRRMRRLTLGYSFAEMPFWRYMNINEVNRYEVSIPNLPALGNVGVRLMGKILEKVHETSAVIEHNEHAVAWATHKSETAGFIRQLISSWNKMATKTLGGGSLGTVEQLLFLFALQNDRFDLRRYHTLKHAHLQQIVERTFVLLADRVVHDLGGNPGSELEGDNVSRVMKACLIRARDNTRGITLSTRMMMEHGAILKTAVKSRKAFRLLEATRGARLKPLRRVNSMEMTLLDIWRDLKKVFCGVERIEYHERQVMAEKTYHMWAEDEEADYDDVIISSRIARSRGVALHNK